VQTFHVNIAADKTTVLTLTAPGKKQAAPKVASAESKPPAAAPPPPAAAAKPAALPPAGKEQTASGPALLVIHVKGTDRGEPSATIALKGPKDLAYPITLAYSLSGGLSGELHEEVPPGHYRVAAAYYGDKDAGFSGTTDVVAGKTNTLDISLDYSPQYKIGELENERAVDSGRLSHLRADNDKKTNTGAGLIVLGLLGAGVGGVEYAFASNAYSAYESATTSTAAESSRADVTTDRDLFSAGSIVGAIFLIWGSAVLHGRPAPAQISTLEQSVQQLNVQIQTLNAEIAKEK
jgi:hypothetical protein